MSDTRYEASMNFDLENVATYLERLNSHLGLNLDVPELVKFTSETEIEIERAMALNVNYQEKIWALEYRVFMDDIDAPDLYFFTASEALAQAIEEELESFAEELGI